jgi:hypothetical protein
MRRITIRHRPQVMAAPSPSSPHAVDPPFLVVTSKTALPKRCVVTNEPVSDSEYQIWELPSISRFMWWLTFTSPILLVAHPFNRRKCRLAAGLSKKIRRRQTVVKLALILLIITPLCFAIAAIVTKRVEYIFAAVATSVLPYVGFPLLVLVVPPLRVHRQRGDRYWIRGCSPEFLATLESGDQYRAQE